MITKRAFLTTGAASLAILGGLSFVTLNKSIEEARKPWSDAKQGFGDPRLDALAYAILAPNPHNRQPWQVALSESDPLAFTVYCDLTRLLPETDPPNRQITIGFGAFLELFCQAAAENGYETQITPFPEGEPFPVLDQRPIASVKMVPSSSIQKDSLFGQALERRTNRYKFDESRTVSADTLSTIISDAGLERFEFTTEESRIAELKDICQSAWHIEMDTPRTHHESTSLTRSGAKAVITNPDGISLSGPAMEAYSLMGMMSEEKMNDPDSQAFAGTRKFYGDLIDSAMAFGWLTSPDNSRKAQLDAGQNWVRLNLAASKAGLALQPLSQALQEFPEMEPLYTAIHELLGISRPASIQGLFRFGYAAKPAAAPRWPLSSRLIERSI